ncbi:MAG: RES domain-containing protein [Gemmataceae bacterium]
MWRRAPDPMIQPLAANTHYYRVTTVGRKWGDVLSGKGALFLPASGNRYNVVLQQAAYVTDDLRVAVTEFAYYAALDWQLRIANHHVLPVRGPIRSDFKLWQFTLQLPRNVVDIERLAPLPGSLPTFALLNPSRAYAATQNLANHVIASRFPGHPPPQLGLKVPAVRSRLGLGSTECSYVLYRIGTSPAGTLTGQWKLRLEFRDMNGNAVTGNSGRIDWARPQFTLLPVPRARAAAPLPPPYVLHVPNTIQINYL